MELHLRKNCNINCVGFRLQSIRLPTLPKHLYIIQHLAGGYGDIVDDHVADFLIENGIPLLESWKESEGDTFSKPGAIRDRDKKILLTGGDHMYLYLFSNKKMSGAVDEAVGATDVL
ncbi:hypothetical protein ACJX0J_008059 [Zea mays]